MKKEVHINWKTVFISYIQHCMYIWCYMYIWCCVQYQIITYVLLN